jgi:hypothetical protein
MAKAKKSRRTDRLLKQALDQLTRESQEKPKEKVARVRKSIAVEKAKPPKKRIPGRLKILEEILDNELGPKATAFRKKHEQKIGTKKRFRVLHQEAKRLAHKAKKRKKK